MKEFADTDYGTYPESENRKSFQLETERELTIRRNLRFRVDPCEGGNGSFSRDHVVDDNVFCFLFFILHVM